MAKRLAELRVAPRGAALAPPPWQREERWRSAADGRGSSESEGAFAYFFEPAGAGAGANEGASADTGAGTNEGAGSPPLAPLAPLHLIETHEDTAGRVWDAAVQLCKALELGRSLRRGGAPPLLPLLPHAFAGHGGHGGGGGAPVRVLEIGAGLGLVSLVTARLLAGPARVLATDLPGVVPRIRRNLEANGFAQGGGKGSGEGSGEGGSGGSDGLVCVRATDLRWGDAGAAARAIAWLGGRPQLVLASDLAATVAAMAPCVETMREVMARDSVLLLACHTHRDSTAPLLEGLRAFCSVRRVRDEALPATHRSAKHELYRVAVRGGEADAAEEEAAAKAGGRSYGNEARDGSYGGDGEGGEGGGER